MGLCILCGEEHCDVVIMFETCPLTLEVLTKLQTESCIDGFMRVDSYHMALTLHEL